MKRLEYPGRQKIFFFVLLLLFLIFSVALINNPEGPQKNIFFSGLDDLYADFFNVLRYISERDPYFNPVNGFAQKAYLPVSYLVLYPFSQLDSYSSMSLQDCWQSKVSFASAMIFTIISTLWLFVSLMGLSNKHNLGLGIILSLFISSIFVFSIERGNLIILTVAMISTFLQYYDSENNNYRLLASICLAIAVGIKVYPVLFGMLYFEKRQFKDIFISALLTLIIIFLPFLFFKRGFTNIPQLIHNLNLFKSEYDQITYFPRFGLSSIVAWVLKFLKMSNENVLNYIKGVDVFVMAASIVSILLSLVAKDRFLRLALITSVVICYPLNSALYCGLYLFPLIVYYMADDNHYGKGINIFFTFQFIVMLSPFQFGLLHKSMWISFNYIITNLTMHIFWLTVFIITSIEYRKSFIRNKKKTD